MVDATEQPEPDPALCGTGSLSLSTRIEYTALPKGETRDVFALVTAKAVGELPGSPGSPSGEAGETAARQPMDIACVLDVSASMRGEKILNVQRAVQFIIEQAEPNDRISIVAFNNAARRETRLQRMSAEGKDSAIVATMRLRSSGGTSIAEGLDVGLQIMEQRRQRNKVSAILLLTDGQDRGCEHRLRGLMQRAAAARCQIYAFGFGADHDAGLLSNIAEQAQTPFTFVEDTDKIREAFAGAVGGLSSIVAQQVAIQLQCSEGVRLKQLHTAFVTEQSSDTEATTIIPDMFAGESRDILIELVVPAAEGDGPVILLEAQARYTDLVQGCLAQTEPVSMQAERVEVPQPEAEPDEEVAAQRSRVEVTRVLQEAAKRSDEGQFEEACLLLEATEQQVSSRKQTRLSPVLEQELQDARHRMKSRSDWELGGRAEVHDAAQMHKMQRCTNLSVSSKSCVQKRSKTMYASAVQRTWISSSST